MGLSMSSKQVKQTRTETTEVTEVTDELSLDEAYQNLDARRTSRDKKMTAQDYIKKYGGLQTAPNRLASGQEPKHFFSDDGNATPRLQKRLSSNGTPTTYSQSQTQATTPRSSLGTPSKRIPTPKSHSHGPRQGSTSRNSIGGSSPRQAGTPRSHATSHSHHHPPSPRIPTGTPRGYSHYPPVTPRQKAHNRRDEKQPAISRRETVETESQSTFTGTTFSKSSPRSRPEGHRVHGSPVMVMKSYENFSPSHTFKEEHEVLYLGDEFGEV
jgi:hypothetical protein